MLHTIHTLCSTIEYSIEHGIEHDIEHNIKHNIEHMIKHGIEHICIFRWLSRYIKAFTLNRDLRLLAFWSTTTGRN